MTSPTINHTLSNQLTHRLPEPDPTALIYSHKLAEVIRQEIAVAPHQTLSFARFMEFALYQPGLGYYTGGGSKLGPNGDFVTAPEISPLFARCIANQCHQFFSTSSGDFLELGPGTGVFARDFIEALTLSGNLPNHYYLLEISAELRERQKQLLQTSCPNFFSRFVWLEKLPEKFEGVIFANEVLDALPTHCFLKEEKEILERGVTWKNNKFVWTTQNASALLKDELMRIEKENALPSLYHSEVNLMLRPFINTLAKILKKGLILLCDYGYGRKEYYHPDRSQGTLKCFYRHHHHDNPFLYPGLQDITAHVDFTTVAESATENGLQVAGYTTQAAFLLAAGLLEYANNEKLSAAEIYQQNNAIKSLTLPHIGTLTANLTTSNLLDNTYFRLGNTFHFFPFSTTRLSWAIKNIYFNFLYMVLY